MNASDSVSLSYSALAVHVLSKSNFYRDICSRQSIKNRPPVRPPTCQPTRTSSQASTSSLRNESEPVSILTLNQLSRSCANCTVRKIQQTLSGILEIKSKWSRRIDKTIYSITTRRDNLVHLNSLTSATLQGFRPKVCDCKQLGPTRF